METLLGTMGMIGLFLVLMAICGFIFWIWMFLDALVAQKEDKFVWILVVFFLNFIGGLVYYFVARKKRKSFAAA